MTNFLISLACYFGAGIVMSYITLIVGVRRGLSRTAITDGIVFSLTIWPLFLLILLIDASYGGIEKIVEKEYARRGR